MVISITCSHSLYHVIFFSIIAFILPDKKLNFPHKNFFFYYQKRLKLPSKKKYRDGRHMLQIPLEEIQELIIKMMN